MMSTLINLMLPNGASIAVEAIDPARAAPVMRGIGGTTLPERTARSFADAIAVLQPMASQLIETLKHVAAGTDGVQVKFGVKFTAEAGVVLAAAGSEASLEVQIKWSRPEDRRGGASRGG